MTTLREQLRQRRLASPRLVPLEHSGHKDPWAEQPPPPTPKDPRVVAATIAATGCAWPYSVDELRTAWPVADELTRRIIERAVDAIEERERIPA